MEYSPPINPDQSQESTSFLEKNHLVVERVYFSNLEPPILQGSRREEQWAQP